MIASKRPSTSSLRRFITTRSYVTIAELRRRFGLDEPDVCCLKRDGRTAFIGLPEREALKLQELWLRDEIGLEMSVEVRAPVVIGIYPMRIARFMQEQLTHGPASSAIPGDGAAQAGPPAAIHAGAALNGGSSNGAASNGRSDRGPKDALDHFAPRPQPGLQPRPAGPPAE